MPKRGNRGKESAIKHHASAAGVRASASSTAAAEDDPVVLKAIGSLWVVLAGKVFEIEGNAWDELEADMRAQFRATGAVATDDALTLAEIGTCSRESKKDWRQLAETMTSEDHPLPITLKATVDGATSIPLQDSAMLGALFGTKPVPPADQIFLRVQGNNSRVAFRNWPSELHAKPTANVTLAAGSDKLQGALNDGGESEERVRHITSEMDRVIRFQTASEFACSVPGLVRDDAVIPVFEQGQPFLMLSKAPGSPVAQGKRLLELTQNSAGAAIAVLAGVSGCGKSSAIYHAMNEQFGVFIMNSDRECAALVSDIRDRTPQGMGCSPARAVLQWMAAQLVLLCVAVEKQFVKTPLEWLRTNMNVGTPGQAGDVYLLLRQVSMTSELATDLVSVLCWRIRNAARALGKPAPRRMLFAVDGCQTLLEGETTPTYMPPPARSNTATGTAFGAMSYVFAEHTSNDIVGVFSGTAVRADMMARGVSGASKSSNRNDSVEAVSFFVQDDPKAYAAAFFCPGVVNDVRLRDLWWLLQGRGRIVAAVVSLALLFKTQPDPAAALLQAGQLWYDWQCSGDIRALDSAVEGERGAAFVNALARNSSAFTFNDLLSGYRKFTEGQKALTTLLVCQERGTVHVDVSGVVEHVAGAVGFVEKVASSAPSKKKPTEVVVLRFAEPSMLQVYRALFPEDAYLSYSQALQELVDDNRSRDSFRGKALEYLFMRRLVQGVNGTSLQGFAKGLGVPAHVVKRIPRQNINANTVTRGWAATIEFLSNPRTCRAQGYVLECEDAAGWEFAAWLGKGVLMTSGFKFYSKYTRDVMLSNEQTSDPGNLYASNASGNEQARALAKDAADIGTKQEPVRAIIQLCVELPTRLLGTAEVQVTNRTVDLLSPSTPIPVVTLRFDRSNIWKLFGCKDLPALRTRIPGLVKAMDAIYGKV